MMMILVHFATNSSQGAQKKPKWPLALSLMGVITICLLLRSIKTTGEGCSTPPMSTLDVLPLGSIMVLPLLLI